MVLPRYALQALRDVLAEASKGNAVSLASYRQEVSTIEAADLLNVSHQFIEGLLDSGDIPYRTVGAQRMVCLAEVFE